MGVGIFLAVLGAILTFAVRVDVPGIDLTVVGLILMVAGGAIIAWSRRTAQRAHVVTEVETPADPHARPHTVRRVVRDSEHD